MPNLQLHNRLQVVLNNARVLIIWCSWTMDSQLVTQIQVSRVVSPIIPCYIIWQAAIRGYLLRRCLIHEVREQYWLVAKELEADLQKDMITWSNNINIISLPHFVTSTKSPIKPHLSSGTVGMKKTSRSKSKKKVKTISTQTESPVTSRPGVRYLERSPSQELIDSFSSLSSVDHTPVKPTIKTITMETTKHNLVRNKDTTTKKHHKRKQKHVTSTPPHESCDITLTTLDITQDTNTQDNHLTNMSQYSPFRKSHSSESHDNSTPAGQTSTPTILTSEILSHPVVTQANYASIPPSQVNIPILCNDTQPSRDHPVAGYTNVSLPQTHYDYTPVCYNIPQQSILNREMPLLQQPIITIPNPQIRQDVARWSKFEQLRAKYLTQGHPESLQSRLLKHNLT